MAAANESTKLIYPETKKGEQIDEYFGVKVADPYSWLEDPDHPATEAWVSSQNAVTQTYLQSCPDKSALEARLKEVYNYERYSCPFRSADWIFYFHNSGLQNQSVLYKQRSQGSEPAEVLLDPNTLSDDGTAALGVYDISEDGQYLAYGVSHSGSDWTTIHVRRIADNVDLADKIEWVKFSDISWTHDNKGFFYSRYVQPAAFQTSSAEESADPNFKRGTETESVKNHMVYYHKIGTAQSEDTLVFSTPHEPEWTLDGTVTEDGQYLLLAMRPGCDTKNRLFVAKLNEDLSYTSDVTERIIKMVDTFEAEYSYVNNEGNVFYFLTNHSASRYRLVSFDVTVPSIGSTPAAWRTIIPEHAKDVLKSASIVNKTQLIVMVSRDVKQVLSCYDLEGTVLVPEFKLPDVGSISGLTSRKKDSSFFFSFSSFVYPGTIFSVDLLEADADKQSTVFRQITIPGFDATQFETKQVFYPSRDGTQIPMFIVHRKGMQLDGTNPTWLYGYGGFNISLPPSFSVARVVFMQHFNGIFACPNIRGGGEYGDEWHKAGILTKKQNVFDDFITASEYLISNKYTSSSKLAISGGSNGGLLTAACLNQRPDLFGAVVAQVGVLDMLKFHKWTIGYAWTTDYGSSEQSREMFDYLLAYSPVHTVRSDVPYPALLLCTSDHDDRVVPLHSYKYISEVQSRVGSRADQIAPLLIRVEEKAGHGAGMPLSKRIVEQADVLAFISRSLGVKGEF